MRIVSVYAVHADFLQCTSANRGQPRINTFHHPEKLLQDDDEDDSDQA